MLGRQITARILFVAVLSGLSALISCADNRGAPGTDPFIPNDVTLVAPKNSVQLNDTEAEQLTSLVSRFVHHSGSTDLSTPQLINQTFPSKYETTTKGSTTKTNNTKASTIKNCALVSDLQRIDTSGKENYEGFVNQLRKDYAVDGDACPISYKEASEDFVRILTIDDSGRIYRKRFDGSFRSTLVTRSNSANVLKETLLPGHDVPMASVDTDTTYALRFEKNEKQSWNRSFGTFSGKLMGVGVNKQSYVVEYSSTTLTRQMPKENVSKVATVYTLRGFFTQPVVFAVYMEQPVDPKQQVGLETLNLEPQSEFIKRVVINGKELKGDELTKFLKTPEKSGILGFNLFGSSTPQKLPKKTVIIKPKAK